MRLFIAVPIPEHIKDFFSTVPVALPFPGWKWVESGTLHLTLMFLGEVSEEHIPEVISRMNSISFENENFDLKLIQIEPGPHPKQPRLVWAKFNSNNSYIQLVEQLRASLEEFTEHAETKLPVPHLTLARFPENTTVPRLKMYYVPDTPLVLPVRQMILFRSELFPEGAVHLAIEIFDLAH